MRLGYDIFRRLDDGSPVWVAQVESLAQAEKKLASLLATFPGKYFVRDADTGVVIKDLTSEDGA
jgi:hypothetical protein